MTGYRLHEVLLSIATCAVLAGFVSVRGCQQAQALRLERMQLERFHRELLAAYGGGGVEEGDAGPSALRAPEGYRLVAGAPGEAGTLLVELNRADRRVLEGLPGIGPSTAEAIVATRERMGRFVTVDDLLHVPGIAEKTVARLRPHVWIEPPEGDAPPPAAPARTPHPGVPPMTEPYLPAAAAASPTSTPTPLPTPTPVPTAVVPLYRPDEAYRAYQQQRAREGSHAAQAATINLNTATLDELETLDGIGTTKALAIIEYRNAHGGFRAVDELVNVKGIGDTLLARNRHRLRVN